MESKAGLPFAMQITFLPPEINESNVLPHHAFAYKKDLRPERC